MAPPTDDFWPLVRRYRDLGLDPLKWIAGCSVELDREEVVYPGLNGVSDLLARLGVTVLPGEGPDVQDAGPTQSTPYRVVVRPGKAEGARRRPASGNPHRAAMVTCVHQRKADTPEAFANAFVIALEHLPSSSAGPNESQLNHPITIGRLHAVATPHESGEFALFEFQEPSNGRPTRYRVVNCETLQIADATLDPLAEEHAAGVVTSALSELLALGATKALALLPIFDAPGTKANDALAANFQAVARRFGIEFVERSPVGTGKLLIGATVAGETDREVPNKHHYVKRGMQVTVTRPFGELAPLATYLSCLSDGDYLAKLEASGLSLARLETAKAESLKALTTPALASGEVIHDFSPPFQEPPELSEHLAATLDLTARGIFAFLDLAHRFEVEVELKSLPLSHPEVSRFATDAFLMDNSTACAPGAFAIIAWPSVLDEVERALKARGERPERVGEVVARGAARVVVPPKARGLVASKHMLRKLKVADAAAA